MISKKFFLPLLLLVAVLMSGCGSSSSTPSIDGPFQKKPYLLYTGTNTEMTLLWQLAATQPATVTWGADTSYTSGTATSTETGPTHLHRMTVTNLMPGARYFYRVTTSGGEESGSFLAAPSDTATAVKLFLLGDTRSNPDVHDALAARMSSLYESDRNLQTIALMSGDLVADGESEGAWVSEFFNPNFPGLTKFQAEVPRVSTVGNHEGNGRLFQKYFPFPFVAGRYWSFDYGPLHVVVADQYRTGDQSIDSAQRTWMENDLRTTSKTWKIILLHEPGFTAGGGHDPNRDVATEVQALAKETGAVVVTGHNHHYSRSIVDGVTHVTTGGGGAPLHGVDAGRQYVVAAAKTHHFCTMEINGNTLSFTAMKADGSVIDSFVLQRS